MRLLALPQMTHALFRPVQCTMRVVYGAGDPAGSAGCRGAGASRGARVEGAARTISRVGGGPSRPVAARVGGGSLASSDGRVGGALSGWAARVGGATVAGAAASGKPGAASDDQAAGTWRLPI